MVRKLIINADDFGLVPSVSQGIIKAHHDGIVTSTSVLVNLASNDDLKLLRQTQSLSCGVHLTLTVGPSTLPREEVPTLVDQKGMFHKRKDHYPVDQKGVVSFKDSSHVEIIVELEAQVAKFINLGFVPTHIDTHHHIHLDRKVLDAVIYVASLFSLPVRSIENEMRQRFRESGIPTNDHFIGNFFGADKVGLDNFQSVIADIHDGVTDLMCHPGFLSDELSRVSGYVSERHDEIKTLTDPVASESIKTKGIELTSWKSTML